MTRPFGITVDPNERQSLLAPDDLAPDVLAPDDLAPDDLAPDDLGRQWTP